MILQCSLRTCCAKHHLKRKLLVLQWIWQVQEIHFAETKREVLFLQRESSSLGSCVLIVEISPLEGFSHSHPSTPFHHIVSSKSPVLLQSAWEQQTHWTSGIRINMHGMECHAAFVADVFFVAVRSRWASCVCACLPILLHAGIEKCTWTYTHAHVSVGAPSHLPQVDSEEMVDLWDEMLQISMLVKELPPSLLQSGTEEEEEIMFFSLWREMMSSVSRNTSRPRKSHT